MANSLNTNQRFAPLRREIAGIPVAGITREYRTPVYVYDAATILERIGRLAQFDVIRYAQKANSNLAILALMRQQGVLVDAVSSGEVFRARQAGFQMNGDPPPVVYTADIFDRETLQVVCDEQLHVNVGSPDMIAQYGQRMPGRSITLRVNPGFGHGHSNKTNTGGQHSKHGIWFSQIDECRELAEKYRLTISGLHMHIGSGTDFEHLSQVCDAMARAARQIGPGLQMISAGGGLPTPYCDEDQAIDIGRYFDLWDQTRNKLAADFGHPLSLEIEPGRYLVAEAGFLLTEIRAIKAMGDNLFYLVDAGFNNLARPIMYGAYHPISIDSTAERTGTEQLRKVVIGGPLCESGDIFTQQEGGIVAPRLLPEANLGDILVIECAGAYGFVMSSNYNSKLMCAEVLIRDGVTHLIRERQSFEDLISGEKMV